MRTVRRLVVLAVAVGALGVAPASASGATIIATVTVQGAGTVSFSPGGGCNAMNNLDDRNTVPCGTTGTAGDPAILILNAVPRPTPVGHWSVTWQGCPSGPGNPCVFSAAGPFTVLQVTPKAVFNDSVAPTVTIGSPSYSTTADRTVRFPSLGADEAANIECSIDDGAFAPCSATTDFTLPERQHQIEARARDRSGNLGATTAPQAFRILDTQLVSGPPDFHSSKSATFKFSTLTGVTFDCSLDNTTLADCGPKGGDNTLTKSFSNLPEGQHTFRVRARDGSDFDRVPIVRTWTVDTVAPETVLDPNVGPDDGDVTTLFTAAFSVGANEPASLQCRLAPADFAPCASQVNFADLPFGQQTFQARAIDRAGNVDATPAGRTWNVVAVDVDGDGFNQRSDCNENDPNISPGRPEVPGNAVDENCDGVAQPFPRIAGVSLSHTFKAFRRYTTLSRIQVKGVPEGSTVRATCAFKKKKCSGKAKKAFSKRNARGTVSLNARYKRVRLKVGTKITVRVTKDQFIGAVKILTVRKAKAPKVTDRCLPPGARRPQACPG